MSSPEHNSPTAGCDLQRVQDFLKSDSYHLEDTNFLAHLDVCQSCRDYLEAQAGKPERWEQAATLLQTHEFDQASNPDFSAATHCGENTTQPVTVTDVLDILTPSEYPNHLGRLGTYEVTGVIGVGGMGVVLKAIDPSLDRVVALKVMSPKLAHNENARKRFAREAKAAAAVIHPNVIPIHSVSSGTTLPYLVMSYIRGGSLQKRLDQDGPLPLVEVLRIGSQIAAGLAAAHEQGLIHRDIKPANILLEEGVERVTITDFGLARAVDDHSVTQNGAIAGTPQYMSPEQARGEQLDQKSDLFSLGSVLYALSAGRTPYLADSSYGVMRKIIDDSPGSIQDINPSIPDWFANIVRKLMARDKADRFESAGEVHKLLEACLGHVQQPQGYQLPDIPNPFPQAVPSTTKGVPLMIKFAAGMVTMAILAVLLPFAQKHGAALLVSDNGGLVDRTLNMTPMNDIEFHVEELTAELAERLTGKKENVTFWKVTSLEPDVAAVLARHPGNLSLPSVNQMDAEVARDLIIESKNTWLALDGLKELSPEVARELAAAKCAMRLGIETVTPEVAEILAAHQSSLTLGLQSISPAVAEKLAMHEKPLGLDALRTLDDESAAKLAKNSGSLSFLLLQSLTPDVAAALGSFDGSSLKLNGLESLDPEVAKGLANAKCSSGLYLNGLTEVSPEVINILANGNSSLSFQGLLFVDSRVEQTLMDAERKLEAAGMALLRRKQFQPWLKLDSHQQQGSSAKGETWNLVWKLRGHLVGSVGLQALHIKEGKSHVVSEVVCPVDGQNSIDVQLQLKSLDESLQSKGAVFVPSLSVSLDGVAIESIESEKLNWRGDFHVYGLSMSGMSHDNSEYILMRAASVPVDVPLDRLDETIDEMARTSRKGDDYFAFILTWEPISQQNSTKADEK